MVKGFIVKYEDNVCKAGIQGNGFISLEFVLRKYGSFWRTDGLYLEENKRLCWNCNQMNIGDEIEVELAEFIDTSNSLGEIYDSYEEAMKQVYVTSESDQVNQMLEDYYLLKKILMEEKLI